MPTAAYGPPRMRSSCKAFLISSCSLVALPTGLFHSTDRVKKSGIGNVIMERNRGLMAVHLEGVTNFVPEEYLANHELGRKTSVLFFPHPDGSLLCLMSSTVRRCGRSGAGSRNNYGG